jgi:hypothetical protein
LGLLSVERDDNYEVADDSAGCGHRVDNMVANRDAVTSLPTSTTSPGAVTIDTLTADTPSLLTFDLARTTAFAASGLAW